MIDKYLCSVDNTDYKLIVFHCTERDFYYLPKSYLLRKGRLVNHFKDLYDIEREFDISLTVLEHLGAE